MFSGTIFRNHKLQHGAGFFWRVSFVRFFFPTINDGQGQGKYSVYEFSKIIVCHH